MQLSFNEAFFSIHVQSTSLYIAQHLLMILLPHDDIYLAPFIYAFFFRRAYDDDRMTRECALARSLRLSDTPLPHSFKMLSSVFAFCFRYRRQPQESELA